MRKLLLTLASFGVCAAAIAAPANFTLSWSPQTNAVYYQVLEKTNLRTPWSVLTNTTATRFTVHNDKKMDFFAVVAVVTSQASVALAWDPPFSVTNDVIVGYNLYYGPASRTYTNVVSTLNTTATVSNLWTGVTTYFAATAKDFVGLESDYSAEVSCLLTNKTIPLTATIK